MAATFNGIPVVDLITPVMEQVREALPAINRFEPNGSGADHRKFTRVRFSGMFAYLKVRDEAQRRDVLYRIIPLDLSNGGLGFIHATFAYPGTECAILIDMPGADTPQEITGRITRCELITGRIHSVGIAFDEPIDAARFRAKPGEIKSEGTAHAA